VLAGVDINTVRAWLGHVSINTTNVYAEIDLTLAGHPYRHGSSRWDGSGAIESEAEP
jgi:hypothetical protein